MSIISYIKIGRADHWIKNIFIIPGFVTALYVSKSDNSLHFLLLLLYAFISASFQASANYVLNEYLDADFDKFHPIKKFRVAVIKQLSLKWIIVEYLILSAIAQCIAYTLGIHFFVTVNIFLICGILYNVKPFRLKDRVFFDIILESFNNVLRLLFGWYIVAPYILPPLTLIISFWMAGAFLMTTKRFAEIREIGDPKIAGLYRKSFNFYSENSLLLLMFFYSINFAFFFGSFLFKYRLEYILLFPFISLVFSWYYFISTRPGSLVQNPEYIYREKILMSLLFAVIFFWVILSFVNIPFLGYF